MGQRSQLFVKVENPLHLFPSLKNNNTIEEFGEEEYTILTYHNQWLYGRSLPMCALNALNTHKGTIEQIDTNADKSAHNINPDDTLADILKKIPEPLPTYEFDTKKWFELNKNTTLKDWTTATTKALNVVTYFGEPFRGDKSYNCRYAFDCGYFNSLRLDYRKGDNNDGIVIISPADKSYCFMNICGVYTDTHDVSILEQYKPYSVGEYVRAYYGETPETINPYFIEEKTLEEKNIVLHNIKTINNSIVEYFKEFQVLSQPEINKMFPKVKLT